MSDELGALTYGKKEEQIFLGREIGQNRDFSEDTAQKIDDAVRKLIDEAMATVTTLLEDHRDILTLMAEELLERETIVLSDIEQMVEELRPGKYTSRMKKDQKEREQASSPKEDKVEEMSRQENEPVGDDSSEEPQQPDQTSSQVPDPEDDQTRDSDNP